MLRFIHRVVWIWLGGSRQYDFVRMKTYLQNVDPAKHTLQNDTYRQFLSFCETVDMAKNTPPYRDDVQLLRALEPLTEITRRDQNAQSPLERTQQIRENILKAIDRLESIVDEPHLEMLSVIGNSSPPDASAEGQTKRSRRNIGIIEEETPAVRPSRTTPPSAPPVILPPKG
jgi:hypothetical protein